MQLLPLARKFNKALEGWPEDLVTSLLIVFAIVIVVVAIKSPPVVKVAVLAWIALP